MEIKDLKNIIKIQNSLAGLNNRVAVTEDTMSELGERTSNSLIGRQRKSRLEKHEESLRDQWDNIISLPVLSWEYQYKGRKRE